MSAEAVSAIDLCSNVDEIVATASFVYDHAEDSDKADEIALLLAALRDAKQALAEVYQTVERHLLSMDTPKTFEVVGLGLVERKRSTKRTEWDHDSVKSALIRHARSVEAEPLDIVWAAMRPSWRVTDLRAFGLAPDEFCRTEPGAESIVLPTRELSDRGDSFAGREVA